MPEPTTALANNPTASPTTDVLTGPPATTHGFAARCVTWFSRLVLQGGVSLRAASRVLTMIGTAVGSESPIPDWTTGRLWLLRMGHAKLTAPLVQADDWAWLVDHSVQIGQEKVLVILGLRLRHLPPRGTCLKHEDLELIALVPRKSWTRAEVDTELERAVARTGVPRVIVNDQGVDLTGGVKLFQQRHPRTSEVHDFKHQAACLLKKRLEKHPRWQELQQQTASTRCAIQQTELAFLGPPAPKPKSRYMNLAGQLQWAEHVLQILDAPPPCVLAQVTPQRLQEKLGWLTKLRAELSEWAEWQRLVAAAAQFVNQHGVYRGAVRDLQQHLRHQLGQLQHLSSRALAGELVTFVQQQARHARPGERLPGSTEVLESCFGKFKTLERQQSRGGFTTLLLSFGSMLTKLTEQTITAALQHSPTRSVRNWCRTHLGATMFSQRQKAYAESATQSR